MKTRITQAVLAGVVLLVATAEARAAATYLDGRVLPTIRITPIYYGNSWTSANINSTQAYLTDLFTYIGGGKNPSGKQTAYAEYGLSGAGLDPARTVGDGNPRVLQGPPDSEIPNIIHAFQAQNGLPYNPSELFLFLAGPGYSIANWGTCGGHLAEGDGKYYAFVGRDCSTFQWNISLDTLVTALDANGDGWIGPLDPCFGHVKNFGTGDIALPWDNLTGGCSSDGFDNKAGEALQVLVVASGGGLFHSLRHPNGTWTGFGDVKGQIGDPGPVNAIAAQATAGGAITHIVGAAAVQLFHAVRTEDGAWVHFEDVSAATGSPSIQQVAMANVNDDLHVCATSGPRVLHAVRSQNGSWTKFGDVLAQTGSPPNSVVAVDCAGIGAELHIVMTTFDGGVFHAIRHADGTWTRLGNVQTAAGLGSASVPTVAKFGNDLQLTVVSNSNAREFNTVRHTSNGSWTLAAMLPNSVQVFDHASAGGSLFLHLVSIERGISQQVIWHRTRDIFSNWGPLVNVTSATGISAFPTQVTAAVTAGF